MPVNEFYWEFSFDLYTDKVELYYGKNSHTHAWDDIGDFLIANGFDNKDDKQRSCYFTSNTMPPQKANAIIRKMFRELPWVTLCIKRDSLTIRQENVFSNKYYAERLNNSKQHMERLNMYYEKLGVPNPLKN